MNKLTTLLVAVMLFAVTSSAFAETYSKAGGASLRTVKGEVISVNSEKGSLVIKDEDNGANVAIAAFSNTLGSIKEGDQVSVTTMKGSNLASQIFNLGQAIELAKKTCACAHSK
jgi:high-affinity K+ transport system ATPase subunit B